MDSSARPPRQKGLATGKLVTGAPHIHPEAGPGGGPGVGGDYPASSLIERVFAFLDRYRSEGGSAPLPKRHP